jgi:hypothetical protein
MADRKPNQETTPEPLDKQALAQTIANKTGLGAKYLADQIEQLDGWQTVSGMVEKKQFDEIRQFISPSNKAV